MIITENNGRKSIQSQLLRGISYDMTVIYTLKSFREKDAFSIQLKIEMCWLLFRKRKRKLRVCRMQRDFTDRAEQDMKDGRCAGTRHRKRSYNMNAGENYTRIFCCSADKIQRREKSGNRDSFNFNGPRTPSVTLAMG